MRRNKTIDLKELENKAEVTGAFKEAVVSLDNKMTNMEIQVISSKILSSETMTDILERLERLEKVVNKKGH